MPTPPESPFAPPIAAISEPANTTPGSPLVAVLSGLAMGIGGSSLIGIVFAVASGMFSLRTGTIDLEVAKSYPWTPVVATFNSCLPAVGGYICARISKRREIWLAVVMASITVMAEFLTNPVPLSPPGIVMLVVVDFAVILTGAMFGRRKNRRLQHQG
jgi:hypothetical protein